MSKSLAEMLGIDLSAPTYIAAAEAAKAQYKRAEIRHCPNGRTNYFDPVTEEVFSGFGKAGCGYCND